MSARSSSIPDSLLILVVYVLPVGNLFVEIGDFQFFMSLGNVKPARTCWEGKKLVGNLS